MQDGAYQIIFAIVLLLLNITMSTGVGFIIVSLKGNREANEKRFAGLEKKHEKLSDEHNELKAQLPHHYVLRNDFVRAMIGFDSKLNEQTKDIKAIARAMKGVKDASG